ncbi:MAG TPA: AbrB/MazE/SpoVT family DNA-binding domain-containing protein [Rhizomicrobium sp.]|jgi:antitoxin component of MazEF toxin-antitoxin module
MTQAQIGKWGESLAIRVPDDVAQTAGLRDGESVEIEARNGEILVRRSRITPEQRERAGKAMEEIIADSKRYSLGDLRIKDLINEGRK